MKTYYDWIEQTAELTYEERGYLFVAIVEYARSGKETELFGGAKVIFPVFKSVIDRDNRKAAVNAENGAKGGRPRKKAVSEAVEYEAAVSETEESEPEATEENRTKPNETENNPTEPSESKQKATKDKRQITKDKDKEQRTQNEKQNTKDYYEKEGANAPEKETAERFRAPSLGEIEAYCEESGVRIDAEAFTDYYAARGWTVGSEPMRDWRAAVRNWQRRDRERSARIPNSTGFPAKNVQPLSPRASPEPRPREHNDDRARLRRILDGIGAKEGAS